MQLLRCKAFEHCHIFWEIRPYRCICLLIFPIKLLLCPFCFSPVGLARTRPVLLPVPPSFPFIAKELVLPGLLLATKWLPGPPSFLFLATELVLPGLPGQACSSHCNLDLNKHCLVLPGLRHSCTRKPEHSDAPGSQNNSLLEPCKPSPHSLGQDKLLNVSELTNIGLIENARQLTSCVILF